jgi:subtilisin family serine protease
MLLKKILCIIVVSLLFFSVFPADAFVVGIPGGIGSAGEGAREIRLPAVSNGRNAPIIHGRIIAPVRTEQQKSVFINRGCQVVHDLQEGTAFDCPVLVAKGFIHQGLAIEDELLQPHDLESDVYINADDVWAQGIAGTGVKVAILDTGVDPNHIEIKNDIVAMKNFARGSSNPYDQNGHGTHVIGIVTGEGINSIANSYGFTSPNRAKGVADGGIIPDGAGILSGKVCGVLGCYTSDISKGIEWAVNNGADIISMSLGGGNYDGHCDNNGLAAKANWAVDQGVVVVASAGNDNAGVSSPACGSKVIAVGAVYQRDIGDQEYEDCDDPITSPGLRTCFSNYGPALDLMAPGAAVLSSYSCYAAGDCTRYYYAWYFGTSQAAPHVAGAAALLLAKDPTLSPAQVKEILENTARDLGSSGYDVYYGWGLVDPSAAIQSLAGCESDAECTDGNECTADTCETGTCAFVPVIDDTSCSEGICCSGTCAPATCLESDCDDHDACTLDNCVSPETCSATCNHQPILACTSGDGCCPAGCDATDTDCPQGAVCGDGSCAGRDTGEDCKTCPSDCPGKTTGKPSGRYCCGNGVCEPVGETTSNCPVDCSINGLSFSFLP